MEAARQAGSTPMACHSRSAPSRKLRVIIRPPSASSLVSGSWLIMLSRSGMSGTPVRYMLPMLRFSRIVVAICLGVWPGKVRVRFSQVMPCPFSRG